MNSDLASQLALIPGAGHYLALIVPYLGIVVAIAAFAARFMAPPASTTGLYALLYALVNWTGQNAGHATNANAPLVGPAPPSPGVVVKALAMLIALGLTACSLSGCANGGAQGVLATCGDATAAVVTVTPYKAKMTPADIALVGNFIKSADTVCGNKDPQTAIDAALTVGVGQLGQLALKYK